MTPKEKAGDLVEKYANIDNNCNNFAYDKQCAIIAVEEILNITLFYFEDEQYWQQVKQEIENL